MGAGIADKTTQEVSIVDEQGRVVRDESYIYTGGGHISRHGQNANTRAKAT